MCSSDLTELISKTAGLANRIQEVQTIMGDCLPSGAAEAVNQITRKIAKLTTNADKGCSIPSTQKIGNFTLPTCLNDFVLASGGNTAVASDKKIAGCEVFLNCAGSTSCFE